MISVEQEIGRLEIALADDQAPEDFGMRERYLLLLRRRGHLMPPELRRSIATDLTRLGGYPGEGREDTQALVAVVVMMAAVPTLTIVCTALGWAGPWLLAGLGALGAAMYRPLRSWWTWRRDTAAFRLDAALPRTS